MPLPTAQIPDSEIPTEVQIATEERLEHLVDSSASEEPLIAIFDTETNGMFTSKKPLHDRENGHVAQIAIVLVKMDGTIVETFESIITPEHYYMPQFIADINGITTERAMAEGKPRAEVMSRAQVLLERAFLHVCHNYDFDSRMMLAEEQREYGFVYPSRRCCCTMKELTEVVGARKANGQIKWPKLEEAYRFAFGEMFDNAHDALADVKATARLLLWAIKNGHIKI